MTRKQCIWVNFLWVTVFSMMAGGCSPRASHGNATPAGEPRPQSFSAYVDSIGRQDPGAWMARADHGADSVFQDQKAIGRAVSPADLSVLAASRKSKKISLKDVDIVFGPEVVNKLRSDGDSKQEVPIHVVTPSKGKGSGLEVVVPGYVETRWDNDLFFIQDGQWIASRAAFHKYGLEMDFFVNEVGRTIVHYTECLESGTGIWAFCEYYFTVANGQLIPVLKLYKETNFYPPDVRVYQLTSTVVSENPMVVKYAYEASLGMRYRMETPFVQGNAEVAYAWNEELLRYEPQYPGNFGADKLLSFSLQAPEELFVYAWRTDLNAALASKDEGVRLAVEEYLGQ